MNYIEKLKEESERRTQELYDEAKRDGKIQYNSFENALKLNIAQNWDEVEKYHG